MQHITHSINQNDYEKFNIYKTIPPPSAKPKGPFALFRLRKGGGIVSTWNEMCQNGFLIIDPEHRVAAKSVSDQEATAEIIKDILAKAYINYMIHNGKEST